MKHWMAIGVMVGLVLVGACGPRASSPASGQLGGTIPRDQLPQAAGSSPEAAARQEFTTSARVPYQDVQTKVLKNDGSFATVELTAQMRRDANAPWTPMVTRYEVAKVGDGWRVSSRSDPQAVAAATSTAGTQRATQTVAQREQQAKSAAQKLKVTLGSPQFREGEGIALPVNVANSDNRQHVVEVVVAHCPWYGRTRESVGGSVNLTVPANGAVDGTALLDQQFPAVTVGGQEIVPLPNDSRRANLAAERERISRQAKTVPPDRFGQSPSSWVAIVDSVRVEPLNSVVTCGPE